MDVFNVRDLKERPSAIVHEAEKGLLSLVTKRGHPVFLAVPFSETMLQIGLNKSLALSLLKDQIVTLRQASKLAGISLEEMMTFASFSGIDFVDYNPEELEQELQGGL